MVEWIVWEELVAWLVKFYHLTGYIMTDVNLRNFLYDATTQTMYGLDFEECMEGDAIKEAAKLAAYILQYSPEKTPAKIKIAEYVLYQFSRHLDTDVQVLLTEAKKQEALLLLRRKSRT